MKIKYTLLSLIGLLAFPVVASAAFGDTTTYLSQVYWGDGQDRTEAFFDFPEDIDATSTDDLIIADTFNHAIRKINSAAIVSTVAGTGSFGDSTGTATKSEFAYPKGVAVSGSVIIVADSGNGKIKKIDAGQVSTLVSGLNGPEGVRVYGDTVYFLDTGNNALKKVSINGGSVTTVTGSLSAPTKLDITSDGAYAYVANPGSYQIKKVNLSTGAVSTVAGSGEKGDKVGSCSSAKFENIWGVHLVDDNTLYVSDGDGFSDYVKKVDLTGCTVEVYAEDTNMLSINFPRGLTSHNGELYIVATGIGIIQRYEIEDRVNEEIYAGANRFNVKRRDPVLVGNPKYMVLSKNKKTIYFAENNRIRKVRRGSLNKAPLIAGAVIDNYNKKDTVAYVGEEARFSDIPSIALSKNGKKLFVVDRNNNRIKEVVIKTGAMRYLTGAGQVNVTSGADNGFANGVACPDERDLEKKNCAYFNRPTGSVLSKSGKFLYVADSGNNRIRRVVVRGKHKGRVTTVAGDGAAGFNDAVGTAAQFNAPVGLTLSKDGGTLYVADRDNHRIRNINLKTKEVSTYAGTGSNGYVDAELSKAVLSFPEWITTAPNGDLYFAEVGSNKIRMIDHSLGVTKLVSGSGDRGFSNGSRFKTRFNNPRGLLAMKNKLLVAELYNDVIRSIEIKVEPPFTDAAPVISSLTTSSIGKEWFSGNSASIEVKGKNFRHGAIAWIGSHKANNTYVNSDSVIVIDMPIADMPAGHYTVRIQNSDGQYYDKIDALSVHQGGVVPGNYFKP